LKKFILPKSRIQNKGVVYPCRIEFAEDLSTDRGLSRSHGACDQANSLEMIEGKTDMLQRFLMNPARIQKLRVGTDLEWRMLQPEK
jgi:hypothetical protein